MRVDAIRILALCLFTLLTGAAIAQDAPRYPARQVRMVVPYPAGGSLDTVARAVGEKLSAHFGQPFIVENKPGASTMIGGEQVAKSTPDGYTLLWGAATLALNPALGMKVPYDVDRDFSPVSFVASMPMVALASPNSGYETFAQVLADAKKGPDFLFACAGRGSIGDLITLYLNQTTGTKFTLVPYKGSMPALQDMLAGTLNFMVDGYIPSGIYATRGRLKALAVSSKKRLPMLPDVPTLGELGFEGARGSGDFGLLAPRGTPPAIVKALNAAVVAALASPDLRAKLEGAGYEVHGSSPEEYAAYIRTERERWTKVVKASGLKLN